MPWWIHNYEIWIGAAEAFFVAFLVVAFDCHNNVSATLQRATTPVYMVPLAWLVWTVCGLFAVGAFAFSASAPEDNWVSAALSFGSTNNLYRGFAVGLSILILIRSKVLSAGNSEIGGEYFYNLGRVGILKSV